MSGTIKSRTPQEVRQERLRVLREMNALLEEEEREAALAIEPASPPPDESSDNPVLDHFKRSAILPYSDAIPAYLATCKEPQTCKQIVQALRAAGREFESNNPVHTVRMNIKKIMTSNNDVFQVGWARWHLRSKYKNNKAKLEKLLAESARVNSGTGGRSKKAHSKKTSDAIKKHREAGLPWGRRKTPTETIEKAKEMLRSGSTLAEVCRTLKISTPTLYENGVRALELRREGQRQREAELALGDQTESDNVVRFAKG